MSDDTPRLKLNEIVTQQRMSHDNIDDVLLQIDARCDVYLKGQYVNTPPASPADGDTYITGGAPTGAWSNSLYKLAYARDGGWDIFDPYNGLTCYLATGNNFIVYQNGVWTDLNALLGGAEASIASAATCDLGAAAALRVWVTGTTAITGFGMGANLIRLVRFAQALTLTHDATSLVLLGGASRVTAAGDVGIYASDGSGNWREHAYMRAAADPGDYATKSGTETLSNKTFSGATIFPNGQINSAGDMLVGSATAYNTVRAGVATTPHFQVNLAGASAYGFFNWSNAASASRVTFSKSRGTAIGAHAAMVSDDNLGEFIFAGSDGTAFVEAARIAVTGQPPSAGYAAGQINFMTSAGAAAVATRWSVMASGDWLPGADNSYNLGSASFRAATVFAGSGTINTSAADAKTAIRVMNAAELGVARALCGNGRIYQFCDAVTRKGEGAARLHAGMIFEDVAAAFAAQGLDPRRYGIVCEDLGFKAITEIGADGESVTRIVPDLDDAGAQKTVLGLRYDELAQFVIAGLAARLAALEAVS